MHPQHQGLRSHLWHSSLEQVVQDLTTMIGTTEAISEHPSSPPLHIPVFVQPDSMADQTLDNNLAQSTQTTASAEDASPAEDASLPSRPSVLAC